MGCEDPLFNLMRAYSLKGISDWCEDYSMVARRDKAHALQLPIMDNAHQIGQMLNAGGGKEGIQFIPMPRVSVSQIERAFFAPRKKATDADDSWEFDLFLLLPEGRHLGFRFERADEWKDARHGYSHVQLSWRFGHRCVTPANPLKWLPDSYPAFPVPGKGSLERFLMLVVALHGFPGGSKELFQELDPGRPVRVRQLAARVEDLLGVAGQGGGAEDNGEPCKP